MSSRHPLVMVPPDECHFPLEPFEVISRRPGIPPVAQIAHEIDLVFRRDRVIPVIDQNRIHFVDIREGKRPAAVPYDIGMTTMEIPHDKNISRFRIYGITANSKPACRRNSPSVSFHNCGEEKSVSPIHTFRARIIFCKDLFAVHDGYPEPGLIDEFRLVRLRLFLKLCVFQGKKSVPDDRRTAPLACKRGPAGLRQAAKRSRQPAPVQGRLRP